MEVSCVMIAILIVTFTIFIRLSTPHLAVTPAYSCEAAKTCNHTFMPICGQNQHDLRHRLFMDDCDMFEYNCEHVKEFVKVEVKVCWQECTHKDPLHTPGTTSPATCPMTIAQESTAQSMTASTEASTAVTDTTIATTVSTTTTTEPSTAATTTVEMPNENTTEPLTTITEYYDETTEEPATETNPTTIETTKSTSKETTPTPGTTTEASTAETLITTSAATTKQSCPPEDCFIPSTWETTSETEQRDFFQILKERFGDKVKILRDTTHFPKTVGKRTGDGFLRGRHSERIEENIVDIVNSSPIKSYTAFLSIKKKI